MPGQQGPNNIRGWHISERTLHDAAPISALITPASIKYYADF
jgi:hypothetical protein